MTLIRPKSLRDLALEHIRNRIVDGTLEMGQPLSERSISEELGVSKSPVREALAQLREEGLVKIEPQKGAQVFTLTEDEVEQICDFRRLMENAAVGFALGRDAGALSADMDRVVQQMETAQAAGDSGRYLSLDTDFHRLFFKHCRNEYLAASYERFVGKIAALRTHLSRMPDHTSLSLVEHKLLTAAVHKRDGPQVSAILDEHIGRTSKSYVDSLALLTEFPE